MCLPPLLHFRGNASIDAEGILTQQSPIVGFYLSQNLTFRQSEQAKDEPSEPGGAGTSESAFARHSPPILF